MRTKHGACVVALLATCLAAAASGKPSALSGVVTRVCDRAASPRGKDSAPGTLKRPLATVTRLAAALRPGQTGCLLRGRFDGIVRVSRSGRPNAPTVLRPAPGASATINGQVVFEPGSNYWRLTGLTIDGSSSILTIEVHNDGLRLDHNNITNENRGASCIIDGSLRYGVTHGTIIDHNVIHNCGASNSAVYNHGVYVCCGYGTRVTNNVIYGNSGFGVHLYPDADKAVVANNVIDGNASGSGVLFGGNTDAGSCHATDGASVRNNIVTNNGRFGISAWWGCSRGARDLANHNCLWGNRSGGVDSEGLAASQNLNANPQFVSVKRHDYRLRRGSRCKAMAPRGRVGP